MFPAYVYLSQHQAILEDYALPLTGDHGVSHWARVLENGQRLAEEISDHLKR